MKKSKQQFPNNQLSFLQVAEVEISYNPHFKPSERPQITSSKDAYNILQENWNQATIQYREEFNILLLNRANKVLGIYQVSTGGQAGTVVDPKLVFCAALKAAAASIILVHNHPSGSLKPSSQDLAITKKLVEVGKLLDLPIIDHLIITNETYLSFADEGLL